MQLKRFKKYVERWFPFFSPALQFVLQNFDTVILAIITMIFVITYFESLRWPLPGPRATHGIAKGLALLLLGSFFYFKKSRLQKLKAPANGLMLVFFLSYLVSTAFSLDIETSLLHLWYPFTATIIFFLFSILSVPKRYFMAIEGFSVLLVFVTFVFAFFSIIFRYSVDNIYYFIFLDHRANHLLGEIREFGKYVSLGPYIMLAPLAVSSLFEKTATLVKKMLGFCLLLVAVLTAVISNNRIDVLVMSIQSVIYLSFLNKRQIVMLALPTLAMIWIGLTVTETYFGFNLEERIMRPAVERDQETVSMRYTYWDTALSNFRSFPLFGTGPNTYNTVSAFPLRRYYDRGVAEYTIQPDEGIGIHNLFIERLADTGLFGFFSFTILLFFFMKQDILAFSQLYAAGKRRGIMRYALYSLGSWSWILYGITDNGYGAQGFMTFFFLRGLLPHLFRHERGRN